MTSELYVRSGQIANFGGSASVKMNYKKKNLDSINHKF